MSVVQPPMPPVVGGITPPAAAAPHPMMGRPGVQAQVQSQPNLAPPPNQDDWISGLTKTGAEISSRGNSLEAFGCPFTYQLELISVTAKRSQKKAPYSLIKFKVVASNNPSIIQGMEVEHAVFQDDRYDNKYYYETMFQLAAAAWTYQQQSIVVPRQIDNTILPRMHQEEQLFAGSIVNVSALQRVNHKEHKLVFKDGVPVVQLTYFPVQIAG